jgi:hypothetical protein
VTYEYRLRIWRSLPERDVIEFEEVTPVDAPARINRLLREETVNAVTMQRREAGWGWEDDTTSPSTG